MTHRILATVLLAAGLAAFSSSRVLAGGVLLPGPLIIVENVRLIPQDTVRLETLRAAAVQRDPRAVQPELLEAVTRLRLENLRTRWYPQLSLTGQATYQNEVPSIPVQIPGQNIPLPPLAQTRIQAEVNWLVYDGGRTNLQADIERARLAESQAGVSTTLYSLRDATTEAFFGALLLQAQSRTLDLASDDLEARLALTRTRVQNGAALPADAAILEAEIIRIRQQKAEVDADRRATMAVLSDLTGLTLSGAEVLAVPDLSARTAALELGNDTFPETLVRRPELQQFATTIERLEAEARLTGSALRPEISVFGQGGVGRPSPFDFLNEEVSPFALAGIRLRWSLFDWGQARRQAEALNVQARLTETQAEAFTDAITREIEDERFAIERLEALLEDDLRAIDLREQVVQVARSQFEEGTLLPPEYADRVTDLAEARLALERHQIELARARARLLSTLGQYPEQVIP